MYAINQGHRIVKKLGGDKAIWWQNLPFSDWNTVIMYLREISPRPYTTRTPVRLLLDQIFEKSYMEKDRK